MTWQKYKTKSEKLTFEEFQSWRMDSMLSTINDSTLGQMPAVSSLISVQRDSPFGLMSAYFVAPRAEDVTSQLMRHLRIILPFALRSSDTILKITGEPTQKTLATPDCRATATSLLQTKLATHLINALVSQVGWKEIGGIMRC